MFGYSGGKSSETVTRKIRYRDYAKRPWNRLTTLDLLQVKNEEHPIPIVKVPALHACQG